MTRRGGPDCERCSPGSPWSKRSRSGSTPDAAWRTELLTERAGDAVLDDAAWAAAMSDDRGETPVVIALIDAALKSGGADLANARVATAPPPEANLDLLSLYVRVRGTVGRFAEAAEIIAAQSDPERRERLVEVYTEAAGPDAERADEASGVLRDALGLEEEPATDASADAGTDDGPESG